MEEIPDEVFSTGVLGICCGIEPEEGKVYAPASGKISQLTDTLHAVGIEANGVEIQIHVGVDTAEMNGGGFANLVKLGDTVKRGDLLLTMDLQKIRDAGHAATVFMAVTNSDEFASAEAASSGTMQPGKGRDGGYTTRAVSFTRGRSAWMKREMGSEKPLDTVSRGPLTSPDPLSSRPCPAPGAASPSTPPAGP